MLKADDRILHADPGFTLETFQRGESVVFGSSTVGHTLLPRVRVSDEAVPAIKARVPVSSSGAGKASSTNVMRMDFNIAPKQPPVSRIPTVSVAETLAAKEGNATSHSPALGRNEVPEQKVPAVVQPTPSTVATSSKTALHAYLEAQGATYYDRRADKGCLWIVSDASGKKVYETLKSKGMRLYFNPLGGRVTKGRSAWWTKDDDPSRLD